MTRVEMAMLINGEKDIYNEEAQRRIIEGYCPFAFKMGRSYEICYSDMDDRCKACWEMEFIKDDTLTQILSKHLSKQDETSEKGSAVCGNEVEKYAVDMTEEKEVTRKSVLEQAAVCVLSDRQGDYGDPEDNFALIAEYWMLYLSNDFPGIYIRPEDVAKMMTLLKIARSQTGKFKEDNFIDACGYLSCAAEIEANSP